MGRIDRKLRDRHHRAYLGRLDRISFDLHLPKPECGITVWETVNDPAKALRLGLVFLQRWPGDRSGWAPLIDNRFGNFLIADLFGARIVEVPGADSNPMCHPLDETLAETLRRRPRSLDTRWVDQARLTLRYLAENAPEHVFVLAPSMLSPLDNAVLLRGGAFLMELALEPEAAEELLGLITGLTVSLLKEFKPLVGEPPREMVTIRGHYLPGLRLACDSFVNISPEMIERFIFPVLGRFAEEFGPVLVHCCTEPAEAGHVFKALGKCPHALGFDNWQGFEFHLERGWLAGPRKLAIASHFDPLRWKTRADLESLCPVGAHEAGGRGILLECLLPSAGMLDQAMETWLTL